MYKFPMIFPMEAQSQSNISSLWSTSAPSSESSLICAIPTEFNGPGGGYSPEDLYAMALGNCFVATFKVFAQNSKLTFKQINVKGELAVDRNDKGLPWMARIDLKVFLEGVENKELAQRVLEKTANGCLILNSVKTEKSIEFMIQ